LKIDGNWFSATVSPSIVQLASFAT
jgi:hypothetical protein